MNMNKIKYALHRHFKWMYNIDLTQAQLNEIHDHYHQARKESLKDVIYYRFINMILAFTFLVLFWFFDGNWVDFLICSLFMIYNLLHGLIQWIQYKKIKQPKTSVG